MRAIAVNEYGATPSLMQVPDPAPGAGQLLIRVEAAGMNPMDRVIAEGGFQSVGPAQFPLVLGADLAGVVEAVGEGARKFVPGDEVFGQLLIAPFGSTGTYAERVAVSQDAPLARVPAGLDATVAAALPTAGATAFGIVESVEPLTGKTALLVGAAGGVGSFATQFAATAGANVVAVAGADDHDRLRNYGAAEVIDYASEVVSDAVRRAHPDGIDVLIDVVSDPDGFAALASLVRPGGTALTTRYVADTARLGSRGVTGVNYQVQVSSDVLERLAKAVLNQRVVMPPITRIGLVDVAGFDDKAKVEGKTVITFAASGPNRG